MEMATEAETPRAPDQRDLLTICRALNANAAKYVVVGGMAIYRLGYFRATEDVDLLVDGSRENIQRVKKALEVLPDRAIREMDDDDLETFTVVRVADDILVDLMLSTCGISYQEAESEIEWVDVDGTEIPFASAELMLRMKQTFRDKDELDRKYLERLLKNRK